MTVSRAKDSHFLIVHEICRLLLSNDEYQIRFNHSLFSVHIYYIRFSLYRKNISYYNIAYKFNNSLYTNTQPEKGFLAEIQI